MGDARSSRWWLDEFEDTRAEHVMSVAGQIYKDSESLRQGMGRWSSLYANDPILNIQLGFSSRARSRSSVAVRTAPLALNAVKAVADTYVSMITADKPKVSCVTSGGDWELQRKAAMLEKFVAGVLYENDTYRLATQLNYDVVKFGQGIVKVADERPRQTRIKIERVLPSELLVQADDALYGDPQCMYQCKRVDRLILQELYPDYADKLKTGGTDFGTMSTGASSVFSSDQFDFVVVVEAWHLPQGEHVPGRHSICCGDVTLLDEPWLRPTFPFEFLYRQQPGEGIWGLSLAQELSGLQLAINKLMRDQARAEALVVGHYFVDNATEINTGQISDRIGGIIRYRGTPPQYIAPPAYSDQSSQKLNFLWQKCFETIGVSAEKATSQKPAGLNSGKALLVYADIQSQRFNPSYEEYQHFFLRLSRQIIACARDMDDSFYVRAAGKETMQTVRWADVGGLEDHEFTLHLYPTNALVDDPAARIQQVQDLMTAQLLDPKAGRRLLDLPDLEEFSSYENASYNLTMKMITQIISGGEYVGPEPYMDLEEAIKLFQLSYVKGELENVPEDRLELLSRWISAAQAILNPPQPTAPPQGPPGAPNMGPPPSGAPPAGTPGMPTPGLGGPLAPGRVPPPVTTPL